MSKLILRLKIQCYSMLFYLKIYSVLISELKPGSKVFVWHGIFIISAISQCNARLKEQFEPYDCTSTAQVLKLLTITKLKDKINHLSMFIRFFSMPLDIGPTTVV